jgi:hypothetical protein
LSIGLSIIADVINNFTHVVKEIQLKKWRWQNSSHLICCKVKRNANKWWYKDNYNWVLCLQMCSSQRPQMVVVTMIIDFDLYFHLWE